MNRNPYRMSRGERLVDMTVIFIIVSVIVFVVGSLIWGWATDSIKPNVRNLIIGLIIGIGVVICIVTQPWSKRKEIPYDSINIHVERPGSYPDEDDPAALLSNRTGPRSPGR